MQAQLQKKQLLAAPTRATHLPFVGARQVQRPQHSSVVVRAQADGERACSAWDGTQSALLLFQSIIELMSDLLAHGRGVYKACHVSCFAVLGHSSTTLITARGAAGTAAHALAYMMGVFSAATAPLWTPDNKQASYKSTQHACGWRSAADDELEQRLAALRRAKGATPDKEGAKAKKRAPTSSSSSSSSSPKKGAQLST